MSSQLAGERDYLRKKEKEIRWNIVFARGRIYSYLPYFLQFIREMATSQRQERTPIHFAAPLLLLASVLWSGVSCVSTSSPSSSASGPKTLPAGRMNSPAVQQRNALIAREPRGNYYIGRRWFTEGTRYWGYLRKPGQPWAQSRLVVINESVRFQPDRLPETPADGGRAHGYDHNSEYKFWGEYTGRQIYDPNSNLILPEFRLRRYELTNSNPGFLFYPGEPYGRRSLPPKHPARP